MHVFIKVQMYRELFPAKCVRAARPHTAPLRREAETFEFDKTTHVTRCSCIVRRTIPILKPLDCVCELFTIWQSLCSH